MAGITAYPPNTVRLMMGNEAIARGALEAGVQVATAYPGNPSSEIMERLTEVAKQSNIYVEWAVNEKVALEIAAAASFTGLRSMCSMKHLGINVALDFLSNLVLSGVNGGLVLVVCDDPGALTSTNEQDTRHLAKALDIPLLEPSTPQEAKDMTKWAFELSEKTSSVCLLRSVARVSHARSNVKMGEIVAGNNKAQFDTSKSITTFTIPGGAPRSHQKLHERLKGCKPLYETSPFNSYVGPAKPGLLIVTSGSGWIHTLDAIRVLSLKDSVGILKLGTTWPLPSELVKSYLTKAEQVLVVEEVDSFMESNLKELVADFNINKGRFILGKASGHINNFGENNTDTVIKAISSILNINYTPREITYEKKAQEIMQKNVLFRDLQFCPGCPYRPLFWAVKNALKKDGRNGFVTGDIGCYGMGIGITGFSQLKTMHCMGSGIGVACGLGKLNQFGFDQPVMAACGDSTFFHAALPALVNGIHTQSNFILMFLDNGGTAQTGFQPHPGIATDAVGDPAQAVNIENLCKGLGIHFEVTDPYDIQGTTKKLLDMLRMNNGIKVLICRRECALISTREKASL